VFVWWLGGGVLGGWGGWCFDGGLVFFGGVEWGGCVCRGFLGFVGGVGGFGGGGGFGGDFGGVWLWGDFLGRPRSACPALVGSNLR